MRLLLDTCVLLWRVGDPGRLSPRVREALVLPDSVLCVSAISAFEIAIKYRKGKLELPTPPGIWFRQAMDDYGILEMPATSEIAALAPEIEASHGDPCDRMIMATARMERIPVVTPDPLIRASSEVQTFW